MSTKARATALGTALVLLGVSTTLWWRHASPAPPPREPATPAAPTLPAPGADDASSAPLAAKASTACPGRAPLVLDGRYDVSFSGVLHARQSQAGQTADAPPVTEAFEGTLDATPGPPTDAGREVTVRLSLRSVDLSAQATKLGTFGGDAGLEAAFGREWRMKVAPSGRLSEVLFDPKMPPSVESLVHGLADAAQVAWSDDCAPGDAWQVEEKQVNGPVEASYTRAGDVVRKRLVGRRVDGAYQADGDGELTLHGDRLETVRQDQTTHVDLKTGGAEVVVDGESHVRLRRVSDESALAFDAAPAGLAPLDDKRLFAKADHAFDVAQVAGRSFEQIVQAIEAATKKQDRRAVWLARGDLEALLRLEPARAKDVVGLVTAKTTTAPVRRAVLGTLAATSQGTSGLVSIFEDRSQPASLRRDAIISATFAAPTESTAHAMTMASNDDDPSVSLTAIVAEGGELGALTDDPAPDVAALTAAFVQRGAAVVGPDVVGPRSGTPPNLNLALGWLQALAATRSPLAYPILERALLDEDSWVRETAASGLRYFPNEASAEHIAAILANDPEPGPREQALVAAREIGRGLTLDVVRRALVNDPVDWVRVQAADAIGAWALYRPGLRSILQDALATEKDDTVRQTLQNYITPGRGLENAERVDPFAEAAGAQP